MAAQDIKPGYKQTEIGIIPNDWEIYYLGDLISISGGINTPNVPNGKYINLTMGSVTTDGKLIYTLRTDNDTRILKKGQLIMPTRDVGMGYVIGRTALIDKDNTYFAGNCLYVLTVNEKISSEFIHQMMNSDIMRKRFRKIISGGNQKQITLEGIKGLNISTPQKIEEQEAIAKILWKVDETIEKAQNMIEKLELRNKGLEQKLLKNDTREYKPIEKIASEFSKRNKEDKNIIVLSCTKYDGLVPSLEYFGKKIFSDNLTTYKLIPKGYFAYATNHIEEGSIGYQDKHEEAIISPMYTVFKTNDEINDYFLFRILKTHKYILEYKKRMEGSIDRRGGLRRNVFSKIMVPVPTMEEQNKIMDILDKATKQLNKYKQKLEKLQELKKGLMQQLLTGKVRVKEFRN